MHGENACMLAGLVENQSITSGLQPTFESPSSFDLASVFGKDMDDVGLFVFFHLSVPDLDTCEVTRLARAAELPKKNLAVVTNASLSYLVTCDLPRGEGARFLGVHSLQLVQEIMSVMPIVC